MKRTKCASLMNKALYSHFKRDHAEHVGQSKFSIIIDESTNINVTKFLSISIIYHSTVKVKIVTSFLSLYVLEACTADGIVEGIKGTLQKFKLGVSSWSASEQMMQAI